MSAGKQDKKPGKDVPMPDQRRPDQRRPDRRRVDGAPVPEEDGWERVSAAEDGLDAGGGSPPPEGSRAQGVSEDASADASGKVAHRRSDPASAPADPQSAGGSGEKPQSEPRSGEPLDSKPLDSSVPDDAKPLKSFKAVAGEGEGKVGLSAALDAVGNVILPPGLGKAEQMPLPIVVEPEGGQQGEDWAGAESQPQEGQPQVRGPGRPKGSRNKRTDEWVDYLLRGRRPPLLVLAETYSRPVDQLADELSITKGEAFKLQLLAAKELAPYVHQKQPLAIQVDERGVVRLVIEGGLLGRREAAGEGKTAATGEGMRAKAGGVMVIEGQVIDESGEEGGNE